MDKPFAITLDVGSSLANKTGSWRTERPRYVAPPAAVQRRLPGRRELPGSGSTTPRRATTRRPGGRSWRTTRSPPSWAGSATTRARPPATAAQLDEAVGINSVERFLGDEAIQQGWTVDVAAPPHRQARARRRRRARPASPPPTTCAASATRSTIHDAGPARRRHDALRHPALPAARATSSTPRSSASSTWASSSSSTARSTTSQDAMREGGFDAAFLAVGAHIGKRAYIPAGAAARDARRRLACCAAWRARSRRCSAAASSSTAAATPRMDAARTAKRLGAEEAVVVYRRTRDRMPAHDFEVEEALEEGVLVKWLSTIKHADGGKLVLERMELDDDRLPAADRRARGARGRLARARARPGDRPVAARRRRRHRGRRRRRAGRRAT